MKITKEMIELGARALWRSSTYPGYNKETLDMEWLRMENIWRRQAHDVLVAALQQTPGSEA